MIDPPLHRLLLRQLHKAGIDIETLPQHDRWKRMLQQVNASYEAADQDRYILERSLAISSEEMQSLYQRQKSSYEARLHAILNALPDVLFLLDEDGQCLEVLTGSEKALFMDRSDVIGRRFHDIFPRTQADFFHDAVSRALASNELTVIQYELDIRERRRAYEGRIMPTDFRADGRRTAVFLAIDVTDRQQAELRGRLIETMFQSSREGMLILDRDMRILSINRAFIEITGEEGNASPGEPSMYIEQLLSTDEGQKLWQSVQQDNYWMGEVSCHREDGSAYPVWLTINSVKVASGEITNYVVLLTDISEIKRSREELEYVAMHDALTRLPNRVLFNDRLQQAVARTMRTGIQGALFFLDLDRFKKVNDNLGHHVGDDLLKQVAARLSRVCRQSDTLARLGGDEFTLIVEGLEETGELAVIAEKILAAFETPFELEGYRLDISVSIGISVFPNDSIDANELVRHADTAMYSAKESGRNTYRFYTQELTTNAFEYFAIEMALKMALERGELFLLYQPQFNLDSGEMIGVEALLRWRHPDMGVLSPAMFIHIAEYSGQIREIGEWVIREACVQLKTWDAQGIRPFPVSINLSRKQLVLPELAGYVWKTLNETGVKGERLEFEITESAILDQKDIAYSNLKQLQNMGIAMAIDDFGTGYSSMVNLKQFPLSRLKIDRSFVRDVARDPNDEAIISAIIALGRSFNLRIIAEGVERKEQLDFLRREGCHEVQGFFYSEPVAPEAIAVRCGGEGDASPAADNCAGGVL